ncbi:flagellar assembly protein A [Breznakiella homolactica]|uniref:DUF342 domain-containing protein n=1 Tax=Breznakiella homolactica TaxID=2798577 RepID=A0A7T7XNM3_9SPIR|nr:flagellar assembly protein A [Breznakiella homolactica]QQO09669.1 FapA family protein [Breznakiella homolactica]
MAGLFAKGTASIEIDPRELEAKILFTPEEDGLAWDADALFKIIGEQRLAPLPPPNIIEDFLKKAAKAKAPIEAVLYEGIPPEDPAAEQVQWEELPVPGDVAPFAGETLSKAGPPELFRIKTEKIKRETIVTKPSKLPFLPAKEEVVVTWDKKETREPAEVNPEVRETRYADRGVKLGTIAPPKPGKPGKNVFGRPVPPSQLGDGLFLFGNGIRREKNEIYADAGGIVRIGEDWADILPLAKPLWSVEKGSDGVTLFFKFEPGDPRFAVPSGQAVIAAALEQGADESKLVTSGEIDGEIARSVASGEAVFAYPLFRTQEAEAKVIVSPDKLSARLLLRKGVAGARPLEMKAISQAIKDSGVREYDAEKVKADILAFMQGPDLELKDYTLAEGRSASRGEDRGINYLVEFLPDEEAKDYLDRLGQIPQWQSLLTEDKYFPLSETNRVAPVRGDLRVANISPAREGESGKDVFGNELPGMPGNDPDIKLFQGLHQRGTDIITEYPGLLLIHENGNTFWGQVIDYRDSKVIVQVSEDSMEASMELVKESGAGRSLKPDMITAALKDAGVVRGVDKAALETAYRTAMAKGHSPAQIVARGEAPVSEGGSAVKWLVALNKPQQVNIGASGRADYKNRGSLVSVDENTPLAEINRQGEDGRAGFDVLGNVLPPEQGTSVVLEHDDSVREEPAGRGIRLVAARSGELTLKGNKLSIATLHSVKGDVGPATGNIKFSGEVRISGKVLPGFAVMGGQDVLIGETAESALVSAGGRVVIAQGVIGAGKGVVRARSTIEAAFVEQATLLAVEDIRVKNGCVLCNIKTNGKLVLTGEKGRLVGGVCKARRGVDAASIGTEQGTRTEISFGQDYLIKDQIEVTEREIEKLKTHLLAIDKKIKQSEHIPAALSAARAEKVKYMKLLEQYGLRVFNLREKFEEHQESEIRVRGTIYPGVVMESHDRYYEVKQKRSRVVFYFDRELGRIQERPLQ